MQPLEAAQDLCRLAQRGGAPTPWQMRALQSPSLNQLSDSELADLGDFLAARLRSAGVRALVGEVTPAVVLAMVSAPEAVEDLLAQTHYRQQMVNAVVQAVAEGSALSLEVRSAFGVTTSQHAEVLRHAIRCRALTRADLLACVDNGVALTAKLLSPRASLPLRFETLLDAVGSGAQHPPDWGWNAEVHVNGTQGGFTVLVSNGYELWRAANFPTQEPETVAWLDETFHEGDCLYDIGANIGVYSLYALAKTHTAQAICFEPDAVNYYRLGMNMVANGFGARAVLFPVALSDHTG
ncbi:MAG: FkbM family methyltransferase, partial [Candidatus Tectomicrobia bacterium]|nr:FkbM family methyltransferase [Candidatus Tectomicrobia bacterium]